MNYPNDDYPAGIILLQPNGTNSTMFTQCCETAICDDEARCPSCGRKVVGYDQDANSRRRTRWSYATRHWSR